MERPIILGIPVDNLHLKDAVTHIISLVRQGRERGISQYIGTANAQFISNSHSWFSSQTINNKLLKTLRSASLITADGMPLIWLSKFLQTPLEERVTGADLVPELLKSAEETDLAVYFFGGDPTATAKAVTLIQKSYPKLNVAGYSSPEVNLNEASKWVEAINDAKPDILMIALGNPKQEIWFNQVQSKLSVPVSIGIGGTLNFMSGKVKRAPRWIQDAGLEWFYRILREPGRLTRRYLYCIGKFGYLAVSLITCDTLLRLIVRKQGAPEQSAHKITLPNVVTGTETFPTTFPCVIDCKKLKYFSPKFLQTLLFFVKSGQVALYGVRRRVRLLLKLHRVWDEVKEVTFPTHEEALAHLFRK